MKQLPPLDLCVYVEPSPKVLEARWVARKWSAVISQPGYDRIRDPANDVYWSVAAARCDVPTVTPTEGGLVLEWTEFNRTLLVRLIPGQTLAYKLYVTDRGESGSWNSVKVSEKLETIFFKLGRYVSGKPEKDCLCPSPDDSDSPTSATSTSSPPSSASTPGSPD